MKTKIVMVVEGMSEAHLLKLMTCPKIQALVSVLSVKLEAEEFYFGSGSAVPAAERREYEAPKFAVSLN